MQERWKAVQGFESLYEVSNQGRIKSLKRTFVRSDGKPLTVSERILKGSKDTKGYLQVELKKDGQRIIRFVHRLVAEAFVENPDCKSQVNHKDGNKLNNVAENLEWVTCKENINHAWENDLNKPFLGENHPNHKLTEDDVRFIRKHYQPRSKEFGVRALARKFGVTICPIRRVINGEGWKHVK